MQALAGISFVALIGMSLTVGTRLLLLARRTREWPEWALGTSLVLVMGVAYPGMILLEADLGWRVDVERALMIAFNAAMNVGFLLLYVFTARVFRPTARWPRALVGLAASTFATHLILVAIALGSTDDLSSVRLEVTRYGLLSLVPASAAYVWSGLEAMAHWRVLRRRERLGLVDPVLCDRMWLWSMLAASSVAGSTVTGVYLVLGIDVLTSPSAMLITSITGLAQGFFMWLTFLPPAAYVAFVRRRAGSPA